MRWVVFIGDGWLGWVAAVVVVLVVVGLELCVFGCDWLIAGWWWWSLLVGLMQKHMPDTEEWQMSDVNRQSLQQKDGKLSNYIHKTCKTIHIILYYSLWWFQKCLFYWVMLCGCWDIDSRKMCNSPRVNISAATGRNWAKLQENVRNKTRLKKFFLFEKVIM